jgi:hypothetical protein
MEGDAPQFLIAPTGYVNPTTPFFYPQPQITAVNPIPLEFYVSPDGSDALGVVGSVTAPFASLTNALNYIQTFVLPPITTTVCIFVAPGVYEGNFEITDNICLIGATINSTVPALPTEASNAVVITDPISVRAITTNDPYICIQNVQLDQGVTISSVFFDTTLNLVNCAIRNTGTNAAINIDPADNVIFSTLSARNCLISTASTTNVSLVSGVVSENTYMSFDGCQFSSNAEEGTMIQVTGSLMINNCSLINHQAGTTLEPLISVSSGDTLIPEVNITNSTLKFDDLQTDVAGNKLAIKFDAGPQPITASMTGCVIGIHLGAGQTNIVKNIGADTVTLTQSANSCLLDGKDIDTTNITLPTVAFLQDSPSSVYQATYYKSATQNLTSGNTDLTFNEEGSWNNDNGYITHTGGTTAFTVVQAGLYQLELNATILANGATWLSSTNKQISIDITRSPIAEQLVISQNAFMASGTNYLQSLCSTYNLEAGDVINCRVVNTFTGGPAQASGVTNTFDLNTWFSWRYVGSGGGGGGGGVTSVSAGTGIAVTGSGAVTIDNMGVLSVTNGDSTATGQVTLDNGTGIEVASGVPGTFTFNNTGVVSLELLTGNVDLVEGGGITITTAPPPGANTITIANTGVLSLVPGANITTSGTSTATIGYVATPPSVQAATTTALVPASVNTLFILTSGATQNFTTAGLGVGDAGKVWYVKNGSSADIDIQANGAVIAGQTDTIHQGTGSTNSSIQVLYWSGSVLTMY